MIIFKEKIYILTFNKNFTSYVRRNMQISMGDNNKMVQQDKYSIYLQGVHIILVEMVIK